MSYLLQDQFGKAPSATARHHQLSADIPAGLGINRAFLKWTENWDNIFRASPRNVYETLSRDIAGEVNVFIDMDTGGEGEFSLSIRNNNRIVFDTDNELIVDCRGTSLKFKSWENKDLDSRGQGTGLKLFKNFIVLAETGRIDFIKLRAGKEDGRYFWARHGFYCAEAHDVKRVSPEIHKNIEKYSHTIPLGIADQAREIVDQGGFDMCWKLARLEGRVQVDDYAGLRVKPLGWALLRTDSECNYSLDLHDPVQMARVKSSLERGSAAPVSEQAAERVPVTPSGFAPL